MCRMFGLLGSVATPAEPWLMSTSCSLLRQSHVADDVAQKDGWGIGWYDGKRTPRIEKGIHGAWELTERDRFARTAREAHGPVVVGHVRKASNPMRLPRSRLIALENSQPFQHGSFLFAHNGEISLPRETRSRLGKFEANVQGVNDSEVLFWLLVRHVDESGDPLAAFVQTRDELVDVWRSSRRKSDRPFSGLNVIFSRDPTELWAFCVYLGEHGPSLCGASQPYYQMSFATDSKQLVVGSEPFDDKTSDWRPLKNGEYLEAHSAQGLVGVKTGVIAPVSG